jgi:hypothetical protein
MYYYGKVNTKVVEYLDLDTRELVRYPDGGYLIASSKVMDLATKLNIRINSNLSSRDRIYDLFTRTMAQVGGVLLTQQESKNEQDGQITHTMPNAIDARFKMVVATSTESSSDEGDEELLNAALGETEEVTEEETEVSDEQSVSE